MDNTNTGGNPSENATVTSTSGGTNATPVWYETLPDDLKTRSEITRFKSPEEIAKGYLELNKLNSYDKIPLPGANAKPEEWDAVWRRLGRPDKAEGYNLDLTSFGETKPELDDSVVGWFRNVAFENGLSEKQFNNLVTKYIGKQVEVNGAIDKVSAEAKAKETAAMQKRMADLRGSWGEKFDMNVAVANTAYKGLLSQEEQDYFKSKGINSDPVFVRLMHAIGAQMGEDSTKAMHGSGGNATIIAPAEAQRKANDMINNKSHPLNVRTHANHQDAVKDYARLVAIAKGAA